MAAYNNQQQGYPQQPNYSYPQQAGAYYGPPPTQQQQPQFNNNGYYQTAPPPNAYYPPQNASIYPENPDYAAPAAAPKPPHYEQLRNKNNNGTYQSHVQINNAPKYQDVWATVLFLLCCAGFVVCLVVGIPYLKDLGNDSNTNSTASTTVNSAIAFRASDIGILVGGSAVGGFILSALYLLSLLKYAGKMIKVSMVFQVVLLVATTIFSFAFGGILNGIISALITLLVAWVLWSMRFRIPFAKVMLKTIIPVIKAYPATITMAFIGTILQFAVAVAWMVAVIGIAFHLSKNNSSSGASYAAIVFLIFSFYWISQVIRNTVHVTVSGLFATYYFEGTSTGAGQVRVATKNPTLGAAKRAMTTSFGSICFGSLIIAILQTIKALLRSAADQSAQDGNAAAAICAMCAACFIECIKDILEYFNHYAFTQVAIYGKGYVEAAKATWRLVKERGIDALINDNLIGSVLSMGTFIVGIVGAAYGVIVVYISSNIENTASNITLAAVLCFFVVVAEFSVIVSVVDSGVATTFVCLAEDPRALQRTKPELFEKVREVYPNVMLNAY